MEKERREERKEEIKAGRKKKERNYPLTQSCYVICGSP